MRKACAARITPTTAFVVTQLTRTTPTLLHRAMEAYAVLVRKVQRGAVSRHEAPPGLQRMQRHASESRITTFRTTCTHLQSVKRAVFEPAHGSVDSRALDSLDRSVR